MYVSEMRAYSIFNRHTICNFNIIRITGVYILLYLSINTKTNIILFELLCHCSAPTMYALTANTSYWIIGLKKYKSNNTP